MKLKILAAAIAAVSLPVLAQTTTPAEPRQARVEVSDPAAAQTAPKKASKSTKSTKTAKKTSKKKAKKTPQAVG